MTGLDLRSHVEFRRPHHFGRAAGGLAVHGPGRIVDAGVRAARHHFVIGRVKLDLVAPVAAGIEGAQFWRVLVGDAAPRRHGRRTPVLTELGKFLFGGSPAIGRDRFDQRPVDREQIDILERRRLVEHFVGREWGLGHGLLPAAE